MPDLWFGPNVASDYAGLLNLPDRPFVRFQGFIQQVLSTTPEEAEANRVGPNMFPALQSVDFWRQIGPLALEGPGPKPWSCDGVEAAHGWQRAIAQLQSVGADLRGATLDEPLMTIASYMPDRCPATWQQMADATVAVSAAIRAAGVQEVNIVEAYPHSRPGDLIQFFEHVQQAGQSPSALHLDLGDWGAVAQVLVNQLTHDLQWLLDVCRNHWDIPLGIIVIGPPHSTQAEYRWHALEFAQRIPTLFGAWPDRVIVESWVEGLTGALDFPANGPFDDPTSHVALLREVAALI